MDEIQSERGWSRSELLREFRNRETFLQSLLDLGVDDFRRFTALVNEYYADSDAVLTRLSEMEAVSDETESDLPDSGDGDGTGSDAVEAADRGATNSDAIEPDDEAAAPDTEGADDGDDAQDRPERIAGQARDHRSRESGAVDGSPAEADRAETIDPADDFFETATDDRSDTPADETDGGSDGI
jgi:hypothetical protein